MGAFSWIASLRSQRRAVKYDHRAYLDSRHGEAQQAAAIQNSVASTAERSVGTHQDGGYGCVCLDCFGILCLAKTVLSNSP
jgi:hypothetical protein